MSIVIDASLTLAWYFPDESNEGTDALLMQVAGTGAVAPVHWQGEVANGFQTAIRRGRVDAAYRDSSLRDLGSLGIEIDSDTNLHIWNATVQLSDLHGLTIYDAAYLELAQRRRVPLATLDAELRQAAQKSHLDVLP